MLTSQTGLLPKNAKGHNFDVFQLIWLKLGCGISKPKTSSGEY